MAGSNPTTVRYIRNQTTLATPSANVTLPSTTATVTDTPTSTVPVGTIVGASVGAVVVCVALAVAVAVYYKRKGNRTDHRENRPDHPLYEKAERHSRRDTSRTSGRDGQGDNASYTEIAEYTKILPFKKSSKKRSGNRNRADLVTRKIPPKDAVYEEPGRVSDGSYLPMGGTDEQSNIETHPDVPDYIEILAAPQKSSKKPKFMWLRSLLSKEDKRKSYINVKKANIGDNNASNDNTDHTALGGPTTAITSAGEGISGTNSGNRHRADPVTRRTPPKDAVYEEPGRVSDGSYLPMGGTDEQSNREGHPDVPDYMEILAVPQQSSKKPKFMWLRSLLTKEDKRKSYINVKKANIGDTNATNDNTDYEALGGPTRAINSTGEGISGTTGGDNSTQ